MHTCKNCHLTLEESNGRPCTAAAGPEHFWQEIEWCGDKLGKKSCRLPKGHSQYELHADRSTNPTYTRW